MKNVMAMLALLCITSLAQNTITDQRDGKIYKIVKIGSQTWMAQNMNYSTGHSKCYDNKPENCVEYGLLYDWFTAIKVCPSGWHLPSEDELDTLIHYIENDKHCTGCDAKFLKAGRGWNKGGNGKNIYNFSFTPGGSGTSYKSFSKIGFHGGLWSSTEHGKKDACFEDMYYNSDKSDVDYNNKMHLHSVRCIKD